MNMDVIEMPGQAAVLTTKTEEGEVIMQASREIREVFSEEFVVRLPAEFLQQTVEVMILPLGKYAHQTPPIRHKSLHDFFWHPARFS